MIDGAPVVSAVVAATPTAPTTATAKESRYLSYAHGSDPGGAGASAAPGDAADMLILVTGDLLGDNPLIVSLLTDGGDYSDLLVPADAADSVKTMYSTRFGVCVRQRSPRLPGDRIAFLEKLSKICGEDILFSPRALVGGREPAATYAQAEAGILFTFYSPLGSTSRVLNSAEMFRQVTASTIVTEVCQRELSRQYDAKTVKEMTDRMDALQLEVDEVKQNAAADKASLKMRCVGLERQLADRERELAAECGHVHNLATAARRPMALRAVR